jgi:hypothetical protein
VFDIEGFSWEDLNTLEARKDPMIRMKGSSPVVVLSDKQGSLAVRRCLRSDYKGSKFFPMAFHECTLSSLLKLDSLVKVLQKGVSQALAMHAGNLTP